MKERILTAWLLRSVLLAVSAIAIAAAAIAGPAGEGDISFRLLILGVAIYAAARILDKR